MTALNGIRKGAPQIIKITEQEKHLGNPENEKLEGPKCWFWLKPLYNVYQPLFLTEFPSYFLGF